MILDISLWDGWEGWKQWRWALVLRVSWMTVKTDFALAVPDQEWCTWACGSTPFAEWRLCFLFVLRAIHEHLDKLSRKRVDGWPWSDLRCMPQETAGNINLLTRQTSKILIAVSCGDEWHQEEKSDVDNPCFFANCDGDTRARKPLLPSSHREEFQWCWVVVPSWVRVQSGMHFIELAARLCCQHMKLQRHQWEPFIQMTVNFHGWMHTSS